MNNKYSLGLEDHDRINSELGSGFNKNSIVLLEGEQGSGKSIFSQRFCYGFCKQGLDVSYITPEYNSYEFTKQMKSVSYDVIDYIITDKNLKFYSADVNTKSVLYSDVNNRTLVDKLINSSVWNNNVVIIDGFGILLNNDVMFDKLTNKDARTAIQEFVSYIQKSVFNNEYDPLIIITYNPDRVKKQNIFNPLINVSDAYFKLSTKTVAGNKENKLSVKKFNNQYNQVSDVINYYVQPGVGIIVETKTVV